MTQKGDFETLDQTLIFSMPCAIASIYLTHDSHQHFSEIGQHTSYCFFETLKTNLLIGKESVMAAWLGRFPYHNKNQSSGAN